MAGDFLAYARPKRRLRRRLFIVLLILASPAVFLAGRFGWGHLHRKWAERQRRLNESLAEAAFRCDTDQVRDLLRRGAEANARFGNDGFHGALRYKNGGWPWAAPTWTPLVALASGESSSDLLPIAKMLLKARASVDLDDGYGATPLYCAIESKHFDLALFLIDRGAAVNTKVGVYIDGPSGLTPLHAAADNPILIKALLARGADVNAVTSENDSTLHAAVRSKVVESVRLLLQAGADPGIRNSRGETPKMLVAWPRPSAEWLEKATKSSPDGRYRGQLEASLSDAEREIAKLLSDAEQKKRADR